MVQTLQCGIKPWSSTVPLKEKQLENSGMGKWTLDFRVPHSGNVAPKTEITIPL